MGVQALEGLIEGRKAGALGEDGIEAGRQGGRPRRLGMALVGLQVGIQIPDLGANPLLILAMALIERDQLMDQPLGVDPAQGMEQDGELPGAVADDHQVEGEALVDQAAEQGPFGGDAAMALAVDAQGIQVGFPAGASLIVVWAWA